MKKKRKFIQKDNLNPLEKKIVYIGIVVLFSLIFLVIRYYNNMSDLVKEHLEKYPKNTICEVTGTWYVKLQGNVFTYKVKSKKYKCYENNDPLFEIGEYYVLIYSKKDPEISMVDITKPVIFDINSYIEGSGKIISIYKSSTLNKVKVSYEINEEEYIRAIYVKNTDPFKVGMRCKIIINKENNKIAYISGYYIVKNKLK
ncbi:hypothetical protein E0494_02450 [Marinilabiliaceae bacterium JC040]|nr:hypothetical protein [Marinilabiliaceae bacterium JC040]